MTIVIVRIWRKSGIEIGIGDEIDREGEVIPHLMVTDLVTIVPLMEMRLKPERFPSTSELSFIWANQSHSKRAQEQVYNLDGLLMLCKTHLTFPEEFEPEQLFLCASHVWVGVGEGSQTLNTKFSLSGPEPLHTYMSCSGLSPSVLQPAPHISLRNWLLQAQHDRYVTYESYLLHCQGPHLLQNQFIQRTVCQNQSSKSRKSRFLSQQAN